MTHTVCHVDWEKHTTKITYDDIYNNDEIYVEEYKRRCFIS